MSYVVKSSLDIGGKILPWNEQEVNKLIKEKEEKLKVKEEIYVPSDEQVNEQDAKIKENASNEKEDAYVPFKKNRKKDRVGED